MMLNAWKHVPATLALLIFITLCCAALVITGGNSVSADDRIPFFSDKEWQAMPKSGSFDYELVEKDGIRVPRQNGRGLMGISAGFSNADIRQLEYEAPILAQQGINHLKMGMRPEGWGWADWMRHQAVLQRLGISSVWSYYAMCGEDGYYCRFLEMTPEELGLHDQVTFEDGRRGYFRGMGTLGNIFMEDFKTTTDRVITHAKNKFDRFPTVVGYQYSNEVQLGTGSYDPEARASWQQFLAGLFKDRTPAVDSNGDGVFFNKTFGTNYGNWDQVEQFRGDDWKDRRKCLLRDAWLGSSYADFVNRASARARKGSPDLLTGAMICVPLSPTVDLSLVLSRPNVSAAYINTYFCWLGGGLAMEAISDTYRKPAIASEINMPMGNYEQVKWGALTHLPYLEGFEWFYYSWAPKSAGGEHGGKYGFVDTWTIDTTQPIPENYTEPFKAVEYNERFAIIPQLAPFVGRLHSDCNRNILWVSAGGYSRDWLEDHEESWLFRANLTSDVALALAPNALDLDRYKVIVYRNLQSPCISREIYRKLKGYVRSGGTVITGAYFIGANGTWLGEDNTRDWWQGMKLARSTHGDSGATTIRFGGREIEVKGTFGYLTPTKAAVTGDGEVQDSTGARYPFLLVRNEGRGKWVYINSPFFFQLTEPYENYSAQKYADRMECLADIVRKYSGQELPDRYATQWYKGEDCVLAIRQDRPGGDNRLAQPPAGVKWPDGKYVMFDAFDLRTEEGRPYVEVRGGRIRTAQDLGPGQAKLWVVKPYGKPVVLYADGTLKNGAKLESGTFANKKLAFKFAERAFISSPLRPTSLTVGGKRHEFTYDENTHIVSIERTGAPAEAVLTY